MIKRRKAPAAGHFFVQYVKCVKFMAIYKVLRYPDERLRTECVPVTDFDDEFRKTADDMFETMYKNDGVGLAAPQVNIHRRFVVIDCGGQIIKARSCEPGHSLKIRHRVHRRGLPLYT